MTRAISKSMFLSTALTVGISATPATAQVASDSGWQIDEVIVTAQRRSERLSDVPVAITALSSDQLIANGIANPESLQRAVPGFTYATSNFGTPTYNLRGVGTYDATLGAAPAVAVYVDETPLPFAAMTAAATLDLERIEVLKGPQGILYGQNSTGGAINYIAAKPQSEFGTGFNVSYGRFNRANAEGYITGPLSDTLKVRFAARQEYGDGWQRSYTRDDELGSIDRTLGRLLVDWDPTSSIRNRFSLTGSIDRSDTQAMQFIDTAATIPVLLPPVIESYPASPKKPRAADWDAGLDLERNNRFYQIANRFEIDLSDEVSLISVSAYSHFKQEIPFDNDGTSFANSFYTSFGKIDAYNQELRLQGDGERLKWVLGGNYQHAKTSEDRIGGGNVSSVTAFYPLLGITDGRFNQFQGQRQETWAVFGDIDYSFTEALGLDVGIRYTKSDIRNEACTADIGNGGFATNINFLLGLNVQPGGCATVLRSGETGLARQSLNEDNISWRANLHWKANEDTLLYASVTKGYKSGIFPNLGGLVEPQYDPATQEALLAYETGLKTNLLDHKLQINAAAFYYDYTDKQLRGRAPDPLFNSLEAILNIPDTRVIGGELEAILQPLEGLTLTGSAAYLDTEVRSTYSNYDPLGVEVSFTGEPFPLTPKWQVNGSVNYEHALSGDLVGFVGGGFSHRSGTDAAFAADSRFRLEGYTLLDLNAGIRSAKGWSLQVWGRNITSRYYRTNVARLTDTIVALAGEPATYGITATMKFGGN